MSTSCNVAVKLEDGSFDVVYGHFDGYISGVGITLHQNYNTLDAVKSLISMGDFCSLDITINQSEFYHRDKGEDFESVKPFKFKGIYDLEDAVGNIEFFYVFEDGAWVYYEMGSFEGKVESAL